MGAGPRIDRLDRNLIINGLMEYWQRVAGNTTTINDAAGGNTVTADRMLTGRSGPTVKNYSIVRSTDVPTLAEAGGRIPYSYQVSCLTALGAPAATDVMATMQHRFEGYDYAENMYQKKMTFGMWVKLTAPSVTFPVTNFPISFQTNTHTYVAHVTIDASGIWQFVTVTVDMGTFGSIFDNTLALRISIGSVAGTNFNAPSLNTWSAGDFFKTSSSFNFMGFNTNVLRVTGMVFVQGETMNSGVVVRAGRDFRHELALCQRYYEKSYDVETIPTTVTDVGRSVFITTSAFGGPSAYQPYKVTKRAHAIPTVYRPDTGAANSGSGSGVARAFSLTAQSQSGFQGSFTSGATEGIFYQWSADAEL